jgi:hypothetical protein
MSRHRKALIFLTALLAATLSYASFASAKTDNITVLTYTARQVEFHFVDIAPTGGPPSLGDTIVFRNDLYKGGRKVGFDGGTCTAVRTQHHPAGFHAWPPRTCPTGIGPSRASPSTSRPTPMRSPAAPSVGATLRGRWSCVPSTKPP